ncbi:hypothetical protein [Pseudoalteromonas mariniglutinosa]|uniref:hypothetical protein n=1 Tax=Pseudoalteromonas mariniglutinosa TaxID=206042 RepID=UPI00384C15EE
MKLITLFVVVISMQMGIYVNAKTVSHIALVEPVVAAFKAGDKQAIAKLVHYPLKRKPPLPAIEDQQQLLAQFNDVFDEKLVTAITESQLRTDWTMVGWRGVMFDSGKIWLDFDGTIWSVPYESETEQARREKQSAAQKLNLHSSIAEFAQSILHWHTASYRIRIDDLGDNHYRYVAWQSDKSSTDKPDLVLYDGTVSVDGSGGNRFYTFTNKGYRYVCYVNVIATETMPAGRLTVYKNAEMLSDEAVVKVY